MQVVIKKEETNGIGDKWSKDTNDKVDMHPINLRKGHKILSEYKYRKSNSLKLKIALFLKGN